MMQCSPGREVGTVGSKCVQATNAEARISYAFIINYVINIINDVMFTWS